MKTVDFSYFSERYLAGEMNEAEKEWFRNELGKNEKLREEIALRQNINSALRNHEVIQLRSKLLSIGKKKAEEEAAKKPRKNTAGLKLVVGKDLKTRVEEDEEDPRGPKTWH